MTDASAETNPLLDHSYLDELARHLGGEIVAEILADGMINLADRLERMAELDDPAEIAALAHGIIGLAGQIGLHVVGRHAIDLEYAALSAGGVNLGPTHAALLQQGSASLDALAAWLAADGHLKAEQKSA